MFTTASRHKWQKTLAIALGGLGMTTSPMAYGSGSEAQWEQALNRAWQALSPEQKQELRQDERDWIKWQNSLPPEPGANATKNRAIYIQKLQSGEKVNPEQGWNVNPNFDYPTGKLNPHDAQERVDEINAEEQAHKAQTGDVKPEVQGLIAKAEQATKDADQLNAQADAMDKQAEILRQRSRAADNAVAHAPDAGTKLKLQQKADAAYDAWRTAQKQAQDLHDDADHAGEASGDFASRADQLQHEPDSEQAPAQAAPSATAPTPTPTTQTQEPSAPAEKEEAEFWQTALKQNWAQLSRDQQKQLAPILQNWTERSKQMSPHEKLESFRDLVKKVILIAHPDPIEQASVTKEGPPAQAIKTGIPVSWQKFHQTASFKRERPFVSQNIQTTDIPIPDGTTIYPITYTLPNGEDFKGFWWHNSEGAWAMSTPETKSTPAQQTASAPEQTTIQVAQGARDWITKRFGITPEQLEQGIKQELQKAQDLLDSNQPIDWRTKISVFDNESLMGFTELIAPGPNSSKDEPYFRRLEQYARQGDQLERAIEQKKQQFAQQQGASALATAPKPDQQTKVPQDIIAGWEKELSDFWLHPYYHQATSLKFDSVDSGTPMKSSIGFDIGNAGHVPAGTTIYPVRMRITLYGIDGKGGGSRPVTATRYFCQDEFGSWVYLDKLPAGI
jgi:hypothetical protein